MLTDAKSAANGGSRLIRWIGCVAAATSVLALPGCDVVFGFHTFRAESDAGAADAALDALAVDAALLPASCSAILLANPGAPSGPYLIAPDGIGTPAVAVQCDMTTAGGGWTIVYLAPSSNVATMTVPYTTSVPTLLAQAQDALLAFRDASLVSLQGAATFAMLDDWRTDSPFDYMGSDVDAMVSIDGAAPVSAVVRYGNGAFVQTTGMPATCDDAWIASTGFGRVRIDGTTASTPEFGRVCIDGTTGPFYSAFDDASGDYCVDSSSDYDAITCSASLQFSIAIR